MLGGINRASEKRVSALAISNDETLVCFADKFGVVYVFGIGGDYGVENSGVVKKKAVPILAHYCSIITRLVRFKYCILRWHLIFILDDEYLIVSCYVMALLIM